MFQNTEKKISLSSENKKLFSFSFRARNHKGSNHAGIVNRLDVRKPAK